MKVLIVGSGGQGAACAAIMSKFAQIDAIKLTDLDENIPKKIAGHIASPKITAGALNAMDPDAVAKAAEGYDVIIDLVLPWMASYVMQGALKAKVNYVNTAFDVPFWDELREGSELTLDSEFKKEGLTALLGCGMAPGFTNVVARYYANKLDKVTDIKMRIGKKTLKGDNAWYMDVMQPWNPGWSPKQALVDCATPTYAIENGRFVEYAPFTGLEECDFPTPIGRIPVTHHSHEEIYSMPKTFPGLLNCDFKYYLAVAPAVFYMHGLLDETEVEVGGVKVKPIDVVVSKIATPGDNFMAQTAEKLEIADKTAFVEMIVEVAGEKNGKRVTYKANLPKMNAPGPKLLKLFGTAMVNVALPAVAGAVLISEKPMPGIVFADELDADRFLEVMNQTGYDYKWTETVI